MGFILFLFMCMYVCLLCLCVHHMHTVPAFESEEYIVFPESGVEGVVLGLTWVLGTQVVLSARAARARTQELSLQPQFASSHCRITVLTIPIPLTRCLAVLSFTNSGL